MNRRTFLGLSIGGISAAAAMRTWPFRVFSFPKEIVPLNLEPYFGFYNYEYQNKEWLATNNYGFMCNPDAKRRREEVREMGGGTAILYDAEGNIIHRGRYTAPPVTHVELGMGEWL